METLIPLTIMAVLISVFFIVIIVVVFQQNKKISELKTVLLDYVPQIMDLLKKD